MGTLLRYIFSSVLFPQFVSGVTAFFSIDLIQKALESINRAYGMSLYLPKEAKFFIPILAFMILRSVVPFLINLAIKIVLYGSGAALGLHLLKILILKSFNEKYLNLILNGLLAAVIAFFSVVLFFKLKGIFFKKKRFISMEEIDNFGGGDPKKGGFIFESYVAGLYRRMGYEAKTISELKRLGLVKTKGFDQGADVIVDYYEGNKKVRAVIQCKHYKNKVGNAAIQEVKAALSLYKGDVGIVLTNNYFTEAAIELASANNVQLINRDKLSQMVELDNSPRINYLVEKIRSQQSLG
jgi:restriction system protein